MEELGNLWERFPSAKARDWRSTRSESEYVQDKRAGPKGPALRCSRLDVACWQTSGHRFPPSRYALQRGKPSVSQGVLNLASVNPLALRLQRDCLSDGP